MRFVEDLPDMYRICLIYSWDLPEICLRLAKRCLRYAWYRHIHIICLRYTLDFWYSSEIYIIFALDFPEIYLIYAQDMPEICWRYAGKMPEICLKIARGLPDISIFMRFWHERSALQSVAVRRSTGNDVSGPLFSPLFSIPFHFPFSIFFPFFLRRDLFS